MTTRREFLTTAAVASLGCSRREPAPRRPNLLFVFPDEMRGSAMGFLNQEPVITPNLDRFTSESVVLPEAVSNYPVCSPYRAMLMTGRFPLQNKVVSNCTSRSYEYGVELQREDRCWSDVLHDTGYSLGYIGKWHLEGPKKPYVESYNNRPDFAWNEWTPPERRHGFSYWHAYNTFDRHMVPEYWTTDMGRDERLKVEQWGPAHQVDTAIAYLKNEGGSYRDAANPFALVVAMNPPHMPYDQHPAKYLAPYREVGDEELFRRPNIPPAGTKWGDHYRKHIRDYYAMVTGVDDQFGRLMDALAAQGLAGDTIVVFTSDHGDCIGIHNQVSKNNHYEESMRIPFLIRWPGRIRPRRDDLLLSSVDIYPTLLELMGLADRIPDEVSGTSHAAVLQTGDGPRPDSQVYLRMPFEHPALGRRGMRTHRYTLMLEQTAGGPGKPELYDRVNDPYELENIAADRPKLVKQLLHEQVQPWLDRGDDPWPG